MLRPSSASRPSSAMVRWKYCSLSSLEQSVPCERSADGSSRGAAQAHNLLLAMNFVPEKGRQHSGREGGLAAAALACNRDLLFPHGDIHPSRLGEPHRTATNDEHRGPPRMPPTFLMRPSRAGFVMSGDGITDVNWPMMELPRSLGAVKEGRPYQPPELRETQVNLIQSCMATKTKSNKIAQPVDSGPHSEKPPIFKGLG